MQDPITIFGMDEPLRFTHHSGMLTHDEIKAELLRQIEIKAVKQADVARALNVAPARIAEIRKGDRQIQPNEMQPLAVYLGIADAPPPLGRVLESVAIPHLGKVAQGVWLETSFDDPDTQVTVNYDRESGDPSVTDLFSVTPVGHSMNLTIPAGAKLICQRVPFGFAGLSDGDLAIIERTNHDMREVTCKRIAIDSDGIFWLKSESDRPQFQEPLRVGKPDDDHHLDTEIRVIGKVLRGVIDFSRT